MPPEGRRRALEQGRGRSRRSCQYAGPAQGQRRRRRDRLLRRDGKSLRSIGIQCALCHSTVDDAFTPGIGHRLDGWPNRDLNIGAIVATAPDLSAFTEMLRSTKRPSRRCSTAGGPGKFDAELNLDGKAIRPDGKPAATLNPPAFGLAGVNNHTWTGGWGTVSYWNAYVANLEMHGKGNFYDPRLDDAEEIPGRRADQAGPQTGHGRPDHRQAAGAPFVPTGAPNAQAAGGQLQRRGGATRERRSSTARRVRHLPRPAAVHRAGLEHCTRPKRSASTTSSRRAHRTGATAPRRCGRCGTPTRSTRAASTTTAALPPSPTS